MINRLEKKEIKMDLLKQEVMSRVFSLVCLTLFWCLRFILSVFIIQVVTFCLRYVKLTCAKRVEISKQKGILITGATSGIGLMLAKHFYNMGFTIFACYFNEREPGYNELLELEDASDRMFLVKLDVRSKESIKAARIVVDKLLDRHNVELHCLINNAGIAKVGPFEWTDEDSIRDIMDTNIVGMMLVTRQFILRIIQSKGRVVNVGAGLAFLPAYELTGYGTSKSGVLYFSQALHYDLARYGASCCCAIPANYTTNTNITFTHMKSIEMARKKLTEEEQQIYKESIEEAFRTTSGMLRHRFETDPESYRKFAEINNIELVEENFSNEKLYGWFKKMIFDFLGGGRFDNMETSGILTGFEQAVCLRKPPLRVYPGAPFYTHVLGPNHELGPLIIKDLLAKLVYAVRNRYQ